MSCQDETARIVDGRWLCQCARGGHSGRVVVWIDGRAYYRAADG